MILSSQLTEYWLPRARTLLKGNHQPGRGYGFHVNKQLGFGFGYQYGVVFVVEVPPVYRGGDDDTSAYPNMAWERMRQRMNEIETGASRDEKEAAYSAVCLIIMGVLDDE